jgi:spermidine synthase
MSGRLDNDSTQMTVWTRESSVEGFHLLSGPRAAAPLLFSAALFLSAFLLFTAELMVGKMVLPALGGGPMVWNTCLVFFQSALLAGYVYSHGAAKLLGARRHAVVHAALLALPFVVLPFSTGITAAPPSPGNPVGWLLALLLAAFGLPFFVLSTSAVTLQHWFGATEGPSAEDPYFLYAASNLGSLAGLISYPVVVEPMLRLEDQSRIWAGAYAVFVGATYLCAALLWRRPAEARLEPVAAPWTIAGEAGGAVSAGRRVGWVALAFVPSSLMLAVTTYLTTDIAAVPLLWVVPLSLYLITFVVAFGARSEAVTAFADRRLPLVLLPLAMIMTVQMRAPLWLLVPLHLAVFTLAGLLCHGALADDRPTRQHLTGFYFWIALGGMLGGLFNTLVAPLVFSTIAEYPLVLVLACLARGGVREGAGDRRDLAWDIGSAVGIGALTFALIAGVAYIEADRRMAFVLVAAPAFLILSQSHRRPIGFALGVGAMLVGGALAGDGGGRVVRAERTFFGVYRVRVSADGEYRALLHGTTLHGTQAIDATRRNEPLSYYHRDGPFGQLMAGLPRLASVPDVAVVGLGIGSLASYATPEQRWTFFEIDPAVERLARTPEYFTYLSECGDRCQVVLGDARLSLVRAPPGRFGLIVLDAFSSDAIPIHLLTSEAFTIYRSRLSPGGVLALHISNRHLSLGPVLARMARHHGLSAIEQRDRGTDGSASRGASPSHWVVMAASPAELGALAADPRWTTPAVSDAAPLWTDDSASILSVLSYE